MSSVTVAMRLEAGLLEPPVDRRLVGSHGRDDPVVVAMVAALRGPRRDDAQTVLDERRRVRIRPGDDLAGSAAGPPWRRRPGRTRRAGCRPCRRPAPPGRRPRRRRSAGSARGWSAARASACPGAPSRGGGPPRAAATGAGVAAAYRRCRASGVDRPGPAGCRRFAAACVGPRRGQLRRRPRGTGPAPRRSG